jgi:hypothetical protein
VSVRVVVGVCVSAYVFVSVNRVHHVCSLVCVCVSVSGFPLAGNSRLLATQKDEKTINKTGSGHLSRRRKKILLQNNAFYPIHC